MLSPLRLCHLNTRLFLAMISILAELSLTILAQGQTATAESAPTAAAESAGINARFVDPEMNVSEWIERFEGESRETYANRAKIVERIGLPRGAVVADVGAGTGFFSRLFSKTVGDAGWVYAIDISPRFIEHIARVSEQQAILNVSPILSSPDSVRLPPGSVDVVFVCDTYHHFEQVTPILRSIHRALRSGGTFLVIDFERIPGASREWVLSHVRADKATFRAEIEAAGFAFTGEIEMPEFAENYYLRFQKREVDQPVNE